MRMPWRTPLAMIAVLLALTALAGCVEVEIDPDKLPEFLRPEAEERTIESSAAALNGGREMPFGTHGHGTEILLIGGTTVEGLFAKWGSDGVQSTKQEGFALYWGSTREGGPARTCVNLIDQVPDGTRVVLLLDRSDLSGDVQADLAVIDAAINAAADQDIDLVLCTAFPLNAANTTEETVAAHESYNSAVRSRAEAAGARVFDLYSVLVDYRGGLTRGYALLPTDPRLSPGGYSALSGALMEFLAKS